MRRTLTTALVGLVLAAAASASAAPGRQAAPGRYALETLDAMVAEGRIDEATRGLYLLEMLHAPEQLPAELRLPIEPGLPCLTSYAVEGIRAASRGGPEVREAARRLLDDPPATVGFVESEEYPIRVHYQEESDLDLAAFVLDAAEDGWRIQVEELGWTPPTAEVDGAPYPGLELYVIDTPYGYSGYCQPLANNDLTSWSDALTRCEVDRSNDRYGLAETVMHEMNHAFQFSEDAVEFMSAWEMFCVHTMNEIVEDNWEWMYFIPHFQADPEYAIFLMSASNQMFHYGTALFAQYLAERFDGGGADLAPRLWQAARQDGEIEIDDYWVTTPGGNEPDLFDAIDAHLVGEHGSSLEEAFTEFAEWRLLLGALDDGAHFEHGGDWMGAEVSMEATWEANELPVVESPVNEPPMPTGTSYVQVRTDGLEGAEQLEVSVDLSAAVRWAVQVVRVLDGEPAEVVRLDVEESHAEGTVLAAGAQAVILAVTNLGDEEMDPDDWPVVPSDFTYSLELLRQPEVTAITPAAATAGMTGVEVQVAAFPVQEGATLDLGPGITAVVTAFDREGLTATIDLAEDATPGARDVTVTNPGSDPGVLAGAFEVLPAPAPRLDGVEPGEVEPGSTAVLTVTGAGLLDGAVAALGAGVTVTGVDVVDGTRLFLTVTVADRADPGPRTLTVTNPGGGAATLADAVEVLSLGGDESGGCACHAAPLAGSREGALAGLALLAVAFLLRRR